MATPTHDSLTIAVLNDIHLNMDLIEKLKKYWFLRRISVDYLIVCGDLVNISISEQENAEIVDESFKKCHEIIKELEKLCVHVLFVPGNHDPTTLFNNTMSHPVRLTKKSVNLHRVVYHLRQNLVIVGCGGSIPQYDKHICHKGG